MTAELRRRAFQLRALARLQPGIAHATRGELGTVAVQVHLLEEILAHVQDVGADTRTRLAAPLERARRALERLERSLAGYLGAFAAAPPSAGPCDLAGLLRDLSPLLSAGLRERRIEWRLEAPDTELRVAATRDVIRDLVTISVAALMEGMNSPGNLSGRLSAGQDLASLALDGGSLTGDPDALQVVADALTALGGTARTDAASSCLVLEMPLADKSPREPAC